MLISDPNKDAIKLHESFMNHLCEEHKIKIRNGNPVEFSIDEFCKRYYKHTPLDYFKKAAKEMAVIYGEIQTNDVGMRLHPDKVNNCSKYHKHWNS